MTPSKAMKKNLILTAILVIVAIFIYVGKNQQLNTPEAGTGSEVIVDTMQLASVDSIEIAEGESKFYLVKDESSHWFVAEDLQNQDNNFPADAQKVSRLFDSLSKVSAVMQMENKEGIESELEIDGGKSITLFQGDQSPYITLSLGKTRSGGGQYIKAKDMIFLSGSNISLQSQPNNWELKKLIDVDDKQIKTVQFSGGGKKAFSISREDAEKDFTASFPVPKGKEINSGAFAQYKSLLSNVNFSKRYDSSNEEAKTALLSPQSATVELFDGTKITVKIGSIGSETKKHFIAMDVRKSSTIETDLSEQLDNTVAILEMGYFEIPSYIADKFTKKMDDFMKDKSS